MREELCLGCGICAQNCPQGAIYLSWNGAQIDHDKCNSCGLCLKVCPQEAITERIATSPQALIQEIQNMKSQTDDILVRIKRISSTEHKKH